MEKETAPMLTEQMIIENTDLVAQIKDAGEQATQPMSQDEFLEWLAKR